MRVAAAMPGFIAVVRHGAGAIPGFIVVVRRCAAAELRGAAMELRGAAVGIAALVFVVAASCIAPSPAHAAEAATSEAASFAPGWHQQGRISYYGRRFDSRSTASGEAFDPDAMTMAHPTLPLGSIVRVKNLRNGRSVELRVNDRGPYQKGRIADVSRAAARKLGMLRHGVTRARIELLKVGEGAGADADDEAGKEAGNRTGD